MGGADVWQLFRPLGVSTCSKCCEALRPVENPAFLSGLACDTCRRTVLELEKFGLKLLACRGDCPEIAMEEACLDRPLGGCAYVVCTACSRLPHSERPYRAFRRATDFPVRKRPLDV